MLEASGDGGSVGARCHERITRRSRMVRAHGTDEYLAAVPIATQASLTPTPPGGRGALLYPRSNNDPELETAVAAPPAGGTGADGGRDGAVARPPGGPGAGAAWGPGGMPAGALGPATH